MSMSDADGQAPARRDPFRDWTLFTVAAALGTAIAVAIVPERGPIETASAGAIAIVVEALYLLLARSGVTAQHENTPRAWIWAAAALVLFAAAVWLDQWSSLLLFAISPAVFLAFRVRTAIPIIVLFDLVPLAAGLLKYPITVPQVAWLAGTAAVTMAVSIFFSGRIQAVIRESEERRRLIGELRDREAQVAALSTAQGAAAERARIAREMHDTLAQGFASIVALGNATQAELASDPAAARGHLELITATAAENLAESRRIIAALTPGRLDGSSLPEALRRTLDGAAAEAGIAGGFWVEGEARPMPAGIDVVLLRVAQEALTNVRRHAHAARVDVRLGFEPATVGLDVVDDGAGFDPAPDGAPGRFGLAGMADRVAEVGGELTVDARPGAGTRLHVRIPLEPAA